MPASPPLPIPAIDAPWVLYLLACRSGALYAGITTDLTRRFRQHVEGRGAKYTRSNPPVSVAAACGFPDRASASRAEHAVKQLPRARKVEFVRGGAC